MLKQRTIQYPTRTVGIGLHSGYKVELVLRPAAPDTGIVFHRTDLKPEVSIAVGAEAIGETMLASTLVRDGVRISTIEHLMSACSGLGIDNLHVDVNAEEIPIMDGSASSFVFLRSRQALKEQDAPKKYIRVKKPVEISEGEGANRKWARLEPYNGFKLDFFIEFNHPGHRFDSPESGYRIWEKFLMSGTFPSTYFRFREGRGNVARHGSCPWWFS